LKKVKQAMVALSIPDSIASAPAHDSGRGSILDVVLILALGMASVAFAPLLHTLSPVLAIAVQALIACAIAIVAPGYTPVVAIFALLFQNLFVSLLSPIVVGPSELEFIKGYNFLACSVMWLTLMMGYVLNWRSAPAEITRLMLGGTGVLAVIGLYYLIGFVQEPLAATIYLRNIVFPLFMFQLSLLAAWKYSARATQGVVAIAVLAVVCGYVEVAFRDFWLDVTNGHAYWHLDGIKAMESGVWEKEMRATGNVMVELKDRFRFDFLNTPLLDGLGLTGFLRVFGPNISPISYAYGLGFFILFLCATRHYVLAACAVPLMFFCGVKGALILMLFVAAGWIGTVVVGALPTLILGVMAAAIYALLGIYIGLQIGDYHVIGFMGGWNGFLQAPLGRGIGIGGNLSGDFTSVDWSAAQHAGAVDGAVESAVGVLLYQMGIAALVPLAFYAFIALRTWRLYRVSGLLPQGLAAFGLLITLVNGIFQEEALFAPLALAMFMCLAGLAIGHAIRVNVERAASLALR
jgi:hypothetical protein